MTMYNILLQCCLISGLDPLRNLKADILFQVCWYVSMYVHHRYVMWGVGILVDTFRPSSSDLFIFYLDSLFHTVCFVLSFRNLYLVLC
jgi:hypothetical protein